MRRDDRGETLLELLVTVLILGTAVVALITAVAASLRVADLHRKQAVAGAHVRTFAEEVEKGVAANPGTYFACAGGSVYQALAPTTVTAPYQAQVTAVDFWDGTTFVNYWKLTGTPGGTCPAGTTVHRVSLRVRTTDDRVAETLEIVVRRPCRPGETCP